LKLEGFVNMAIESGNKVSYNTILYHVEKLILQTPSIVEAPISTLAAALSQGHINSVELTAKHLIRIAKYDRRTIQLNAVPIINQDAFDAAQASDQRRGSGTTLGLLDGIPGTIKDSYKMKGMTIAAGSPAFKDLVANEDAFTVQKLREAGAVLLGRTNMPPMAAGGMQRGVYGRAESPYNKDYLTAAFASGSSNGSATATAASFGAFGMGEETISSGRSPASNNGLVAYTPSRGLVSIRGNWPLFPTCDTVVPHTRSMDDMFALLDVIVAKDPIVTCDFWREQPFVKFPEVDTIRPKTFFDLSDPNALQGKRIGVPKMYIGGVDSDPDARKVHTRESIMQLWNQARKILEGLGATVIETDFPLVTKFEKPEDSDNVSATPPHRNEIDMCQLMAYTWDDFLTVNQDSKVASTLAQVESSTIFPHPPGCLQDKYDSNDPLVRHTAVVAHITDGRVPTFEISNLGTALQNLETTRKTVFENWLDDMGLDTIVWPCNADVGKVDADVNKESAEHAWLNGVLYSNGNCAIRQFGIPTVSVPMGVMADIGMPVNLTFASKAYDDNNLFRYAYAVEKHSRLRQPPSRTPELETDIITLKTNAQMGLTPPQLTIDASATITNGEKVIVVSGKIDEQETCELYVYIDGEEVKDVNIVSGKWKFQAKMGEVSRPRPEEISVPDFKAGMVIVVATGKNGRSTGKMVFI
jgi:Asp-tRNA(Asn)/Glu-tRNA(Gln) amidotransferase A subunit family amidase